MDKPWRIALVTLAVFVVLFIGYRFLDLWRRQQDFDNCIRQLQMVDRSDPAQAREYEVMYQLCNGCMLRVNAWRLVQ